MRPLVNKLVDQSLIEQVTSRLLDIMEVEGVYQVSDTYDNFIDAIIRAENVARGDAGSICSEPDSSDETIIKAYLDMEELKNEHSEPWPEITYDDWMNMSKEEKELSPEEARVVIGKRKKKQRKTQYKCDKSFNEDKIVHKR